ncbi:MAG TPA: hypothetical protein VLM11_20105 [Streptosporangiaceae bacterium]|nr:hypothetical protein [Streptosporangiaceae bacterium]
MARNSLWLAAATALASCAMLAACGGSSGGGATVPSLGTSAGAVSGGGSGSGHSRASALHAAAACIRQHGIPTYHDPVLTPSGLVYTDSRSLDYATSSVMTAAMTACQTLIVRASLQPGREPLAPPQLVQAGVRSAECARVNGLPNMSDPTARSTYTPGHGFGLTAAEVPAGGKASPGFQEALRACHTQFAAEIRASTLGSLGHDG